jgi:hypothetical protein
MSSARTFSARLASVGGALALAAAGLVGSIGLVAASSPAGADTGSFTSHCALVTGPTDLTVTVIGSITPNPVSSGSSLNLHGLGLKTALSLATQKLIPGATFSGTFTSNITAVGAVPSSQPVTFTIPPTTIPAVPTGPLPITAPGVISPFTAGASGSVKLSIAASGSLNATLNGAPIPPAACTQPAEQIATATIKPASATISTVLPNAGPTAGGTTVKIIGNNLNGPSAVTFGGIPATSFHGLTSGSVEAVVPHSAGSATGPVSVVVTTAAGGSTPGTFTYTNGPVVTGVRPSTGQPAGGTSVVITGHGFAGASGAGAVKFGSADAASYTVDSDTSITATAPAGTGVVNVVVTVSSTASIVSSQDRFSYRSGYWLDGSDGGVFAYGNSPFEGSAGSLTLNKPVVGMASTPDGGGYWLVASDGGVFSYGDAQFFGSAGSLTLNKPVVGMASTPDGFGYWLVASDGGVFSYGDAQFFGSAGSLPLVSPVVGIASSTDGFGYWLVASDGGVFSYGDAHFHGSLAGTPLNGPVVGIAGTPDGNGYWLATATGGVFNLGDATAHGSASGLILTAPVVGLASSPDGNGYWLAAADGGIFSYGDATFYGSAGGIHLNKPIVGIAAVS